MLLQQKFRGTGIAIVTPFLEDRSIDWNSLEGLINFWIEEGKVEYLVVLGTTGESATVHGSEKQQLFSFVAEKTNGRVPLVAGIGGYDTHQVLADYKTFDIAGYDAILSVAPYYNKPNQNGLYQHYKTVAEAAPLPVIMYNVPGRTGQNITAETQLKLAADCKNIFATKEASGNLEQIGQIIKYKPEGFLVISGDDGITLPLLAMGADGVTSVVANAFPRLFSDMVRLGLNGQFKEAQAIHYRFNEIITSLFAEGSPSGIKAYLSLMGKCQNTFRLPVAPVSEPLMQQIKQLLATIN